MGWLLVSFIVGIICGIIGYFTENKYHRDWITFGTYSVIWFAVGLVVWGFSGSIIAHTLPKPSNFDDCRPVTYSMPIVSLDHGTTVSGNFILGFGQVDTGNLYYVYKQTTRGLKLTSFDAYDVYLKEGNYKPHYERVDHICPQTFYDWFAFSKHKPLRWKGNDGTLFVPLHTVKREFKVN